VDCFSTLGTAYAEIVMTDMDLQQSAKCSVLETVAQHAVVHWPIACTLVSYALSELLKFYEYCFLF